MRGALDVCLLALLSEEPTHAYDLVVRLEERGLHGVGYGTIYPLVGRLRRNGLLDEHTVPSPAGPARKVFDVSAAGRVALSEWVDQWLDTTSAVRGLLQSTDALPTHEKERA